MDDGAEVMEISNLPVMVRVAEQPSGLWMAMYYRDDDGEEVIITESEVTEKAARSKLKKAVEKYAASDG